MVRTETRTLATGTPPRMILPPSLRVEGMVWLSHNFLDGLRNWKGEFQHQFAVMRFGPGLRRRRRATKCALENLSFSTRSFLALDCPRMASRTLNKVAGAGVDLNSRTPSGQGPAQGRRIFAAVVAEVNVGVNQAP